MLATLLDSHKLEERGPFSEEFQTHWNALLDDLKSLEIGDVHYTEGSGRVNYTRGMGAVLELPRRVATIPPFKVFPRKTGSEYEARVYPGDNVPGAVFCKSASTERIWPQFPTIEHATATYASIDAEDFPLINYGTPTNPVWLYLQYDPANADADQQLIIKYKETSDSTGDPTEIDNDAYSSGEWILHIPFCKLVDDVVQVNHTGPIWIWDPPDPGGGS
jgi:hypothetical protein